MSLPYTLIGKRISDTFPHLVQIQNGVFYDGIGNEILDLAMVLKYTHIQSIASSSWIVNHNLGFKPVIVIFDSSGNAVIGDIFHNNLNQAILTFSAPFGGEAYCS